MTDSAWEISLFLGGGSTRPFNDPQWPRSVLSHLQLCRNTSPRTKGFAAKVTYRTWWYRSQVLRRNMVISASLGPNQSFLVAVAVTGLLHANASPSAQARLPLPVPGFRRSKNRSGYWLCLLGGASLGVKMQSFKNKELRVGALQCRSCSAVFFYFLFLMYIITCLQTPVLHRKSETNSAVLAG